MTLTYREFEMIAMKAPWILNGGVMILMTESAVENDHLFRLVSTGPLVKYRRVWSGRPDAYIPSRGRPMREFLDFHQIDLDSI